MTVYLNIKTCEFLLSNLTNISNSQPLEVVDRGSEAQPQRWPKTPISSFNFYLRCDFTSSRETTPLIIVAPLIKYITAAGKP